MIGLHVKSLCENKSNVMDRINECSSKISDMRNEINELKQILQEIQNNYISSIEINDLVVDIKQSFELFMNQTPREQPEEFKNILERIANLENKFPENMSFEIIDKTDKKIPKLNLKKKT